MHERSKGGWSKINNTVQYKGNGVSTLFPIPFPYVGIEVLINDTPVGNYSVSTE